MKALLTTLLGVICAIAVSNETSSTRSLPDRERLVTEWRQILGPEPQAVPLSAGVAKHEPQSDHDRYLVTYNTEPGIRTDAFVLVPHGLQRSAPAAVVFHATSRNHILQPIGLADAPTRHLALHLVRRGFITISPRCYIYGEADAGITTAPLTPTATTREYTSRTVALQMHNPGLTGIGKMLWDGQRAVDYLLTRDDVDTSRIVAVGHSLGAKEALYLAAFDTRVAAAIASEGGVPLSESNWDAVWYLGNQIKNPGFTRDHDDLLVMIAPRSFLALGGGSADGEKTTSLFEKARARLKASGSRAQLEVRLHSAGHDIPADERERAFDWLEEVLGIRLGSGRM